jgi:hypothetical protein
MKPLFDESDVTKRPPLVLARDLLKPETIEHYYAANDQLTVNLFEGHSYDDVLNERGLSMWQECKRKLTDKDSVYLYSLRDASLMKQLSGSWMHDPDHWWTKQSDYVYGGIHYMMNSWNNVWFYGTNPSFTCGINTCECIFYNISSTKNANKIDIPFAFTVTGKVILLK